VGIEAARKYTTPSGDARRIGGRTWTGSAGVLGRVTIPASARRAVRQTVLTTIVFAALDAVWLGVAMNGFYKSELGSLARLSGTNFAPVWWAACVVYALLVVGLVVFVLPRATGQPARALAFGALFGGVAYGTYDFTAYAVLTGWSLRMTLVDLWWGAVICGLSAAAVTVLESRFAPVGASQPAPRQSLP
jgi:uncharacterized membrane protein